MSRAPSLAGRAAQALLLTAGFYLLALAIAAALIALPVLEWVYAHRVDGRILVLGLAGGGTILWSLLPRRDRFEAPGPRLTREAQPELFAEIDAVARAAGLAAPDDVYLVPDVNAWVAQRGGALGLGGRRVMGLGLPLLQALRVDAFRAVLAHEFGHYHGGDTRLGPLLYRTRAAIERTVAGLAAQGGWLQKPFLLYGRLFLRLTHGISRAQEVAADALAARLFGPRALARGLRAVSASGAPFYAYWQNEVAPCLGNGVRPPLAEGFAAYLRAPEASTVARDALRDALAETEADRFDTHPALRERLRALPQPAAAPAPVVDARPALALLRDPRALEQELLATMFGAEARALEPIAWDDTPHRVFQPEFTRRAERLRETLGGARLTDLPRVAPRLVVAGDYIVHEAGAPPLLDDDTRRTIVAYLAALVTVLLVEQFDFELISEVGRPLELRRRAASVDPFALAAELQAGLVTDEAWRARMAALGLTDAPLLADPPAVPA